MKTRQLATLIYIHGYNSSPQAAKAQAVLAYLQRHLQNHLQSNKSAVHYITPWVPPYPGEAAAYLENLLEEQGVEQVRLIGSSLGGFYASYLTRRYGVPSVLVNPAVRPFELMESYLGDNQNPYSGEKYQLNRQHIEQLRALDVIQQPSPEKILLLVQKGDETLDYREALAKYRDSEQIVEDGGSHQFAGFERWIPRILDFLKVGD
jgi:hypothetical protein